MNYPASTAPEVLVAIMFGWVILSLFMGGKKAYFDAWDSIPEDSQAQR